MQFLARNGFFVIIDNHSEDSTAETDPDLWVSLYTQLITEIAVDPASQQRVLVDILNAPGRAGLDWQTVKTEQITFLLFSSSLHACDCNSSYERRLGCIDRCTRM